MYHTYDQATAMHGLWQYMKRAGLCILGSCCLAQSALALQDRQRGMRAAGQLAANGTLDAGIQGEIEQSQYSENDLKKIQLVKLSQKLGLPYRSMSKGMKRVRESVKMSRINPSGTHHFQTRVILDWDKAGIRTHYSRRYGPELSLEFSTRYQGLKIHKEWDHLTRLIEVKASGVTYSASIPLDELAVKRIFRGINVFGLLSSSSR